MKLKVGGDYFREYLDCPECKKRPPYCEEHRGEVNTILGKVEIQ
jgi:hypothetical protein